MWEIFECWCSLYILNINLTWDVRLARTCSPSVHCLWWYFCCCLEAFGFHVVPIVSLGILSFAVVRLFREPLPVLARSVFLLHSVPELISVLDEIWICLISLHVDSCLSQTTHQRGHPSSSVGSDTLVKDWKALHGIISGSSMPLLSTLAFFWGGGAVG